MTYKDVCHTCIILYPVLINHPFQSPGSLISAHVLLSIITRLMRLRLLSVILSTFRQDLKLVGKFISCLIAPYYELYSLCQTDESLPYTLWTVGLIDLVSRDHRPFPNSSV